MKKVLIVDDQREIRRLINLTLSKKYALLEADNADAAWEILTKERPDALILDVMMQGEMDGYQLCRRIKNDPAYRGIYVALVTARGQETDRAQGDASGADAYFVKPFSPMTLMRHLDQTLGHN